jgi:hypothetical protein
MRIRPHRPEPEDVGIGGLDEGVGRRGLGAAAALERAPGGLVVSGEDACRLMGSKRLRAMLPRGRLLTALACMTA